MGSFWLPKWRLDAPCGAPRLLCPVPALRSAGLPHRQRRKNRHFVYCNFHLWRIARSIPPFCPAGVRDAIARTALCLSRWPLLPSPRCRLLFFWRGIQRDTAMRSCARPCFLCFAGQAALCLRVSGLWRRCLPLPSSLWWVRFGCTTHGVTRDFFLVRLLAPRRWRVPATCCRFYLRRVGFVPRFCGRGFCLCRTRAAALPLPGASLPACAADLTVRTAGALSAATAGSTPAGQFWFAVRCRSYALLHLRFAAALCYGAAMRAAPPPAGQPCSYLRHAAVRFLRRHHHAGRGKISHRARRTARCLPHCSWFGLRRLCNCWWFDGFSTLFAPFEHCRSPFLPCHYLPATSC